MKYITALLWLICVCSNSCSAINYTARDYGGVLWEPIGWHFSTAELISEKYSSANITITHIVDRIEDVVAVCRVEDFMELVYDDLGIFYLSTHAGDNTLGIEFYEELPDGEDSRNIRMGILQGLGYSPVAVNEAGGYGIALRYSDIESLIQAHISGVGTARKGFVHIDGCGAGNFLSTWIGADVALGPSTYDHDDYVTQLLLPQLYGALTGEAGASNRNMGYGLRNPIDFTTTYSYATWGNRGSDYQNYTICPVMLESITTSNPELPYDVKLVFDTPIYHDGLVAVSWTGNIRVAGSDEEGDYDWSIDNTEVEFTVEGTNTDGSGEGTLEIYAEQLPSIDCMDISTSLLSLQWISDIGYSMGSPDPAASTMLTSFTGDSLQFFVESEYNTYQYIIKGLLNEEWLTLDSLETGVGLRTYIVPTAYTSVKIVKLYEEETDGDILYHGKISRDAEFQANYMSNIPSEVVVNKINYMLEERLYERKVGVPYDPDYILPDGIREGLEDEIPAYGANIGIVVTDDLRPTMESLEWWFEGIYEFTWIRKDDLLTALDVQTAILSDPDLDYVCLVGKWNDSGKMLEPCPPSWEGIQQELIEGGHGQDSFLDIIPTFYEEDPMPRGENTYWHKWYASLGDCVGIGNLQIPVSRLCVSTEYELQCRVDKIICYTSNNTLGHTSPLQALTLLDDENPENTNEGDHMRMISDEFETYLGEGVESNRIIVSNYPDNDQGIIDAAIDTWYGIDNGIDLIMITGPRTNRYNFARIVWKPWIDYNWYPYTFPFWIFSNACSINYSGTEGGLGRSYTEEWNNVFDKLSIGSIASTAGTRTSGSRKFWEYFMESVLAERNTPLSKILLMTQQELLADEDLPYRERKTISAMTMDGFPTLVIETNPGVAMEITEEDTEVYQAPLLITPNPFRVKDQSTKMKLSFQLAKREIVAVKVYDTQGRLVKELVSSSFGPGVHSIEWDGKNENGTKIESGVYYCKIDRGDVVDTHRIVVLR